MKHDNTVEATLQAWQQQVDQVRQRRRERGGGHAGLAGPEQVQGLTGLQVMLALLEGDLPHPYMADTFDCEPVEVGERHAVFQATPQLKHYNPLDRCRGAGTRPCSTRTRLRGADQATSRTRLHDQPDQSKHRARGPHEDWPAALRGRGSALRSAGRHLRSQDRWARRKAVCACDNHLCDLRVTAGGALGQRSLFACSAQSHPRRVTR